MIVALAPRPQTRLADLLTETRASSKVIPLAADDPMVLAIRAEDALGDLLTALQGGEDGVPDLDYAELLSRLQGVVSRAADVVEQVCDTVENIDGPAWQNAHGKTVTSLPKLRSAAADLDSAADDADDGQDALAAESTSPVAV